MARCGISFLGALLLVLTAQPAPAQIGAFSQSPDREVGNNSRARGAQVECGPIGCRPLPAGCRQVRLVLLCHKFRCPFRAAQHGQRESVVARAATNLRRIVAIEFGTWRSGRNGGSSGQVTFA
jgi:hypothetical protein